MEQLWSIKGSKGTWRAGDGMKKAKERRQVLMKRRKQVKSGRFRAISRRSTAFRLEMCSQEVEMKQQRELKDLKRRFRLEMLCFERNADG